MPALIDELARRLDTSPERARRRLRTLLAALRSRIERTGDASLPGLGTFSREGGAWTFTPAESLARSVNHSFEDLESVGVAAEASSPTEGEAPFAAGHAGEDVEERASSEASSEERPSEKEPPEEDASSGEDLFAGISFEESPSEEPSSEEPSSAPGGSDWAFPDSSSSQSSEESAPSWRYAALPAGYLVHRLATSPSPEDVRADRLRPAPETSEPRRRGETREQPGDRPAEDHSTEDRIAEDRGTDAPAASEARETAGTRRGHAEASPGNGGSGALGWVAALTVVLALGLGVWYLLGQQGIAPGPSTVLQASSGGGPADGAGPAGEAAGDAASGGQAGAGAATDSAAQQDTSAASSAAARAYVQAGRIDRAQGGWTVVVASETSRDSARQVAQQFAQQFQGQDYPIDVFEATVGGTARYRVVVGQFGSSEEASQTLQQGGDRFPQDAWSLPVEPAS